jgi:hypothetical protein
VSAFEAIDDANILVLDKSGNLWLEKGPFGTASQNRQQIDSDVNSFEALPNSKFLVLGTDGNLRMQHALTALGHYLPTLFFAYNAGGPQSETVSTDFNTALKTATIRSA